MQEPCAGCHHYQEPKQDISRPPRELIPGNEFDIHDEVRYLLDNTLRGVSKIISFEKLIMFSTNDGDAWIIDIEDNGAHCLMKEFKRQSFSAVNTPDSFYIRWGSRYSLEGNKFIVLGDDGKGTVYYQYPVSEIRKSISMLSSRSFPVR